MGIFKLFKHSILRLDICDKTSETLFGIQKQPEATCPLIDSVISDLRLQNLNTDIEHDLLAKLEKIRENTKNIRAWGQEWKMLAKKLFGWS